MDLEEHLYCKPQNGAEQVRTDGTASKADAELNIDMWYKAGKPFFTKESIGDLGKQLRCHLRRGDKVSVKGLDGATVDFEIETGLTSEASEPHLEYVMQTPCIRYLSVERLKYQARYINLREAYCNLQIKHPMVLRNKITKETVSDFPVESHEAVDDLFKTSVQAWGESEACKKFKAILTSVHIPCMIRKVIGLACGEMISVDEFARRSAFQHALLITVQGLLQQMNKSKDEILCYAQDPVYSDIDKLLLEEANIRILDDPQAFLEIDDSSFIFSAAPDVPVKQIIADLARPAIIVWDKVREENEKQNWEEGIIESDPDSSRVRNMIRDYYDEFEFPEHEHFSDLAIYIRRADSY